MNSSEKAAEDPKWNLYLAENEKSALVKLKCILEDMLQDSSANIILYGSKARGDYDEDSDVDLAIIIDTITKSIKDNIVKAVIEIETEYLTVISPLLLTRVQFEELKRKERRIALDIESDGIRI